MNFHQQKRLNKLDYESFYLLKVEQDNNSFILNISGSTRNIYKVSIFGNSRTIKCDCPDSRSWAKETNCYCKHICFVLFRIFKTLFVDKVKICDEKFLTLDQFTFIQNKLNTMVDGGIDNYQNSDIVDEELLEKFRNLEKNDFKNENHKDYEVENEVKDKLCAICFMDFEEEDELIKCPECKKVLHKECMEKWLGVGNITCVYCRSEVWKDYGINKSLDGDYICLD